MRDATVEELQAALGKRGHWFGYGTKRRFSSATASRAKKTGHAAEQDRLDVLSRRHEWFEGQIDLEPDRLVFINETWACTKMARTHVSIGFGTGPRIGVQSGPLCGVC